MVDLLFSSISDRSLLVPWPSVQKWEQCAHHAQPGARLAEEASVRRRWHPSRHRRPVVVVTPRLLHIGCCCSFLGRLSSSLSGRYRRLRSWSDCRRHLLLQSCCRRSPCAPVNIRPLHYYSKILLHHKFTREITVFNKIKVKLNRSNRDLFFQWHFLVHWCAIADMWPQPFNGRDIGAVAPKPRLIYTRTPTSTRLDPTQQARKQVT